MHKTYRKRCCGYYHVKKWQFYAHFYKTLPKWVPKSDLKWRDFAINPYYQHFEIKANPKNQLKPCIKPTERGIVVVIMLKNDDFMPIFIKCYQNRYQKVTSNDVILHKNIFIDILEHLTQKINLNYALNLQKEVLWSLSCWKMTIL